jgi:hypothetical protein
VRKHRMWLVAVVALIAGLGMVAINLTQQADARQTGVGTGGRTYQVTLLTGDVVTVQERSSGCPLVTVQRVNPTEVLRRSCGTDGHVRVEPAEVAGLLGSVLDPALFDVTTLIAEGYDDASTTDLPLIVRSAGPTRTADLTRRRSIPSLGAIAGRQPKAKAPDLLKTL